MRHDPPNPWHGASLGTLQRACMELAGELGERKRRTPAERARLAEDVRFLLIAVGGRIATGDTKPGTPEQEMVNAARPDLVASFGAFYARERDSAIRAARREALVRAAEFVLGLDSGKWVDDPYGIEGTPEGQRVPLRAIDSDEAFNQALQVLAGVLARDGRRPRR